MAMPLTRSQSTRPTCSSTKPQTPPATAQIARQRSALLKRGVKRSRSPTEQKTKSAPQSLSPPQRIELSPDWQTLNIPPEQLRLDTTLTNGQCFTWTLTDELEWTGCLPIQNQQICLALKQTEEGIQYALRSRAGSLQDQISEALVEYFQISRLPLLPQLLETWSRRDPKHFPQVAHALHGLRVLRQPPLECLFSFICSSNNNIQRITQMVEHLRKCKGSYLCTVNGKDFYSFPTLDKLCELSESALREAGFGYRARFIVGAAQQLKTKGGESYLQKLRGQPREKVESELTELLGVGRKVASCVALFSLDCLDAVPVDTHVFQVSLRHWGSQLSGVRKDSNLSEVLYNKVGDVWRNIYGEYAGYAHCWHFCAELRQFKERVEMVKKKAAIVKTEIKNETESGHEFKQGIISAKEEILLVKREDGEVKVTNKSNLLLKLPLTIQIRNKMS